MNSSDRTLRSNNVSCIYSITLIIFLCIDKRVLINAIVSFFPISIAKSEEKNIENESP